MRHLSLLAHIPSRQELRAHIVDPERFKPEPRLLRQPEIRMLADGTGEIFLPRSGKWRHVHAMHVETARALAEGCTLDEAIERAKGPCPPKHLAYCDKLVRRFVWQLHEGGIVEIPLEAPPPVFLDRYEVVRELGRGGMGVVHLCKDRDRGGALVVVKHAWGWSKPIERAEQSVREEAQALSRFDHPRIPPLIDAFERDGLLHMVRAFAPGKSLNAFKPHLSTLPSEDRMRVLRACAEALRHVHERGLLYLDVKADNFILETIEEGPSLLDFGLCRPNEPGGLQLRGALGSPGHAAPEMVKSYFASEKADVYGLGRTFAMLATGKKLKFRHTQADVAANLSEAGVPEAERDLLVAMCADDAAQRTPSMEAVLSAIP